MVTSMDLYGNEPIAKPAFHASNLVSMDFANIEDVSVTNTGHVTVVTLKCLVTAVFVKMEALVDWGNVFVHQPIPGTGVESHMKTCRNWQLVTNWSGPLPLCPQQLL